MKKIHLYISLLFICIGSTQAVAQRNNLYLELFGNGIVYSLNYDRVIPLSETAQLIPRAGVSYLPHDIGSKFTSISIPTELNILWMKPDMGNFHPETGVGLNLIGVKDYSTSTTWAQHKQRFARITTLRAGIRFQRPTGGWMYRFGILIPVLQDNFSKKQVGDDIYYKIYGGVSAGYAF